MRSISLTEEQLLQLLDILETAKNDAVGWMYEYATSKRDEKMVADYCKRVDAVIALLEQATTNHQPPTPHAEE